MKELHIAIAKELIKCAQNHTVVCYSYFMDKFHISRNRIGQYLENISIFTYNMTNAESTDSESGIFLSSLVVRKETLSKKIPLSGPGFYEMYYKVYPNTSLNEEEIAIKQRNMVYAHDWSTLIEDMKYDSEILE